MNELLQDSESLQEFIDLIEGALPDYSVCPAPVDNALNGLRKLIEDRKALWDALSDLLETPGIFIERHSPEIAKALAAIESCQRNEAGEPAKPVILITVEGGVVQFVSANADVEVIVRDLDDQCERKVSTQSFAVDTLADGELENARAEIEQSNRE